MYHIWYNFKQIGYQGDVDVSSSKREVIFMWGAIFIILTIFIPVIGIYICIGLGIAYSIFLIIFYGEKILKI